MAEAMTDKQPDKILKMVSMILDGCKDLEETKKKVKELYSSTEKRLNTWRKRTEFASVFLILSSYAERQSAAGFLFLSRNRNFFLLQ